MLALIDGDIICYQAGFASDDIFYTVNGFRFDKKVDAKEFCDDSELDYSSIIRQVEPEPVENCLHSVKLMVKGIADQCGADDYMVFLTGKNNFRDEVVDDYKGNRDDAHKPYWYKEIREYLVNVHKAVVVDDMEADDALGIAQCDALAKDEDTVICSIDKDLDMVPGWHYNWRKDKMYFVEALDGYKFFCVQCLTGDATDNIPGLYKITGKRATKCLKDAVMTSTTPTECWSVVQEAYGEKHLPAMLVSAELLWIRQY